jgi:hypothetical protein
MGNKMPENMVAAEERMERRDDQGGTGQKNDAAKKFRFVRQVK